ncbi:5-oxoprolinase subunit PxpB [Robiginitalea sp. IMCC43444]|uniref:5-oxoprolinase subunit PxpB n=1 Tax=Robiginitalea sp. IMCC43444 TaxID=3459121 RepID=UPI0040423783
MSETPFRIRAFGAQAVVLEWPREISMEVLQQILGFTTYLKNKRLTSDKWELIPIYQSLTLISKEDKIDLTRFSRTLKSWYRQYPKDYQVDVRHWELPVCYDKDFGPDLEEVAAYLETDVDTFIKRHSSVTYRVYGIGFLPGFLYLGGIPESLRIPRKASPRLDVPKGTVGLADRQTGIYPQQSPGGWNLVGRCPVPMFDSRSDPPCFISLGDTVRFRPVSRAEYDLHKIEGEVGIYNYKKKFGDAIS